MADYVVVRNRSKQLNSVREDGFARGHLLGFNCLEELISIKKGYPFYIAGAPYSGKTEFLMEMLIQLSLYYKWKHFIYLGETGTAEEIIAELCYKYIGAPYRKYKSMGQEDKYAMTESDRAMAEQWVDEHFVIFDAEDENTKLSDFTIEQFYANVADVESELGIKFDTVSIDPWNDVDENLLKYGGREDKFLKDALKYVRRDAKKNNRVNFIVNHISDIAPVTDRSSGRRYYPPATPNEWAGGKTWYRRAFTMILVYRPPSWMEKPGAGGDFYAENETVIEVQKSKPKGIGRTGIASIYLDWKANRYYEKGSLGENRYAKNPAERIFHNPDTGDYQSTPIAPNDNF